MFLQLNRFGDTKVALFSFMIPQLSYPIALLYSLLSASSLVFILPMMILISGFGAGSSSCCSS